MPASNPPESFAFRVGRLLAQDGVEPVFQKDSLDRVAANLVTQVVERSSNASVAPARVVAGHLHDQLFDLDRCLGATGFAGLAAIVLLKKYDGSKTRKPGRPKTAVEIEELIVQMARDNPRWGYTRIRGALYNLGHEIGRNTVKRILLENGFDPVLCQKSADPKRERFWRIRGGHGRGVRSTSGIRTGVRSGR